MQRRRAKEEIGTGTGCSVPTPTATSGPLAQPQLPPLRRPGLGLLRTRLITKIRYLAWPLAAYVLSSLACLGTVCTWLEYFVQYIIILYPLSGDELPPSSFLSTVPKTAGKAGTDATKVASRRPSSSFWFCTSDILHQV